MRFQRTIGGQVTILEPTQPFDDASGDHHPPNVLTMWSDQELATIGVVKISDAPPPVPQIVSRLQAKLALNNAGLLDTVEAAVAGGDADLQIYWSDAADFHRDHPTLLAMTTALSLTSNQVDDLFKAAVLLS